MNTIARSLDPRIVDANRIAAVLTIVPGLGHIYKGHVATGLTWLFFGVPLALWAGFLLCLATAGAGILLPLGCWAALVFDAYYEKDRRQHHWLPPRESELD